jgi:hypothetical protein
MRRTHGLGPRDYLEPTIVDQVYRDRRGNKHEAASADTIAFSTVIYLILTEGGPQHYRQCGHP